MLFDWNNFFFAAFFSRCRQKFFQKYFYEKKIFLFYSCATTTTTKFKRKKGILRALYIFSYSFVWLYQSVCNKPHIATAAVLYIACVSLSGGEEIPIHHKVNVRTQFVTESIIDVRPVYMEQQFFFAAFYYYYYFLFYLFHI